MNAPAEFVICRHLLSHRGESVAQMARHLDLHYSVVKAAKARLDENHVSEPDDLLRHALRLPRRPDHQERRFYLPNPENWFETFRGPALESGERVAADWDHVNLVPEHYLVYVSPQDAEAAYHAAVDNFGRVAAARHANLFIRIADPWLDAEADRPVVEKGQRLIDYEENASIRLARRIAPVA